MHDPERHRLGLVVDGERDEAAQGLDDIVQHLMAGFFGHVVKALGPLLVV
jgi:hypothetical protein